MASGEMNKTKALAESKADFSSASQFARNHIDWNPAIRTYRRQPLYPPIYFA
jgi:hypothetical protein